MIQKGIRVLEQLFLVPFFITAWGAAYYGEWLTLTIIPSVIAFSDLGFGTAAANGFVLSYASGEKQNAANINKTGFRIITVMIIIAVIISLLTIAVLNYFQVFDKALIDKHEAIVAVSILIISALICFYNQLVESYYRAAQKAALSINLLTIKAAMNLGLGLIVLLMGYGIIQFALSQLIVNIFFNSFYWFKGRQTLGLHKNFKGQIDKKIVKEITSKGLGYLMSPLWQAIYFQGTTFVVRIVLGPSAVAVFNTVRTLSRSINQLFSMVNSSVFPELQYELGAGRLESAKKVFRFSIITVFFIAVIGSIFLATFGLKFYSFWTQNEFIVPHLMWYSFILGILFNALWWTAAMIFRAVNKPYKFAFIALASSILSVLSSYGLSQIWGLNGAAIGSLVLDVLMAFLILPYACRLLEMNVLDIFRYGIHDLKDVYVKIKSKLKIS